MGVKIGAPGGLVGGSKESRLGNCGAGVVVAWAPGTRQAASSSGKAERAHARVRHTNKRIIEKNIGIFLKADRVGMAQSYGYFKRYLMQETRQI